MDTLCKIRDIYRTIAEFESQFEKEFDLSLNEGMLLCSLIDNKCLSSTEIAKNLGLTCSNTSKVIKSVENKKLIERTLGKEDKRQMYFTLTSEGEKMIKKIKTSPLDIPQNLKDIIR